MQQYTVNFIDQYIGLRVKLMRNKKRFSQAQLAEDLNLSVVNIIDMENGSMRVSAVVMWRLTQIFDVKVSYFFDGIDNVALGETPNEDA